MKVAVLDTTKKPLAPTTLRRADLLLKRGKAAVFRRDSFTIILKREVSDSETPDLKLKIDPGSKTSGMAIINQQTGEVVFATNINHRGQEIKKSLDSRRAQRRARRSRKTRYRQPRFLNRTRPEGWLVKAVVPDGKKKGVYVGKVAVRSSGSFNVTTAEGTIQGINYRHCRLLQRADGYAING